MKNYFYNLNKKYLNTFRRNVLDRFMSEHFRTDENFLKVIFKQINELFSHLGKRTASKRDIPKEGRYPDAEKFNHLIRSIEDDVDKLYTAQALISDDLNNLLKFNSTQRANTFENMISTQQKLMVLYIKHKKDISGEVIIENDFQSQSIIGEDSRDVEIDEVREVLTLASTYSETKPVDTDNVVIYFAGKKPAAPLYPNNNVLRPGAHWRIPDQPAAHHIDALNPTSVSVYKRMMIDTPDVNTGIGWTEFEAVETQIVPFQSILQRNDYTFRDGGSVNSDSFAPNLSPSFRGRSIFDLKAEVGDIAGLNKDPELIYMDVLNSLQGKQGYVKRLFFPTNSSDQEEQYKILIPFTINTKITNEIAIAFSPIEGDIPTILWDKSKVFSNMNGRETEYSIIAPADSNIQSNDGYYVCKFNNYITPTRLELTVTYGGDPWHQIPFQMTHYVYSTNQQFDLPQSEGETVSLLLGRNYDIFVDTEANKEKERTRALDVLTGIRES